MIVRIATCLAALVLALLPCRIAAADPFNIYVIVSLTGSAAFLGTEETAALTALENQVNKAGGVRGRPIHFVIQDDQSVVQNTVQLLNDTIAKKANVVLGTTLVAGCGAMTPLVVNGPVVYCFSPGLHPTAGSYVFSAGISTNDYIAATIHYLRDRGLRKLAVMTSNDATGQDAEHGIDAAIASPENNGSVTVIDREHFTATDLSVAAQIARIKASGAQAAILWTVGTPFGTLLREAVQGGLSVPLVTSAGNLNYTQLQGYDSFMPDNLLIAAAPWAAPDRFPNAAFKKYVRDYDDAFKGTGVRPDEGESLAWDPAMLVIDALRKFGFEATPAQIRDYIAAAKGVGVNGPYDYAAIPQRGVGIDSLVMVRWDKNTHSLVGVSKPGGAP